MVQVNGYLEKKENKFLGWIENFNGIVAQGDTEDDVISKLILLLRVKISFDYDLPLSNIETREHSGIDKHLIKQTENKFQLQF